MRLLGTPQSNHHLTLTNNGYHNYIQSVGDITYIPIKRLYIPTIRPFAEVVVRLTTATIPTVITILA